MKLRLTLREGGGGPCVGIEADVIAPYGYRAVINAIKVLKQEHYAVHSGSKAERLLADPDYRPRWLFPCDNYSSAGCIFLKNIKVLGEGLAPRYLRDVSVASLRLVFRYRPALHKKFIVAFCAGDPSYVNYQSWVDLNAINVIPDINPPAVSTVEYKLKA